MNTLQTMATAKIIKIIKLFSVTDYWSFFQFSQFQIVLINIPVLNIYLFLIILLGCITEDT